MNQIFSYATYWKVALADAQLGRGTYTAAQMRALEARTVDMALLKEQSLASQDAWLGGEGDRNAISPDIVKDWLKADGGQWVRAVIYPYAYLLQASHQHGHKKSVFAPEMIAPVSFTVLVNAEGSVQAHGRPGIARELLEPARGGRSILIGSVDRLDAFYDENPFPDYYEDPEQERISVAEVIEYSNRLLTAVCEIDLTDPLGEREFRYSLAHHSVIHRARQHEASSRPLMQVYDALLAAKPSTPLLGTLLSDTRATIEPAPNTLGTMALRSGSMKEGVCFGSDQREALGAALSLGEGQVLAINGPPGTGKTMLIQSLVASAWVNAAIAKEEPPIMVVASTNNQAVTNALDTMMGQAKESALDNRWIPGWTSYGLYLASMSRQDEAARAGYPTHDTMENFERTADLEAIERHYIEACRGHFTADLPNIEGCMTLLHGELQADITLSRDIESLRSRFSAIRKPQDLKPVSLVVQRISHRLSRDEILAEQVGPALGQINAWLRELKGYFQSWQRAANQSQKRRAVKLKAQTAVPVWLRPFLQWPFVRAWHQNAMQREFAAAGIAGELAESEADARGKLKALQRQYGSAIRSVGEHPSWDRALAELENVLDAQIRPRLFSLAARWHEGSWIQEMKATLGSGDSDKRSSVKVERMWRRRAKLSPCLVSTFFTLPRHMNYWEYRITREMPLFNVVDWLITDEAGQCSPEVAGASFALAKRLVAVGDRWQIEPVWSIEPHVDMGNLVSSGVIPADDLEHQLDALEFTGRLASSGSVMAMAQATTRFGNTGAPEPGVMLTTHRRCVPDIIQYCNQLCYGGALIPVRTPLTERTLPSFGYLHVAGVMQRMRGSRINRIDACVLADWIAEHREGLQADYPGLGLSEIIAVVTPFKEQARLVQQQIAAKLGSDAESLTVGTVHALQGAERPVVIFTPAYSSHEDMPRFFDRSVNMLNVAVSRARDSFIVIGDLDVMKAGEKPSKTLYEHMVTKGVPVSWRWDCQSIAEAAALEFGEAPHQEIQGTEEHDLFLTRQLAVTGIQSVVIYSPALGMASLRKHAEQLISRAQQGVRIEIVVSRRVNYCEGTAEQFTKAAGILQNQGIHVRLAHDLTLSALCIDDRLWTFGQGGWLSEGSSSTVESRSIVFEGDSAKEESRRLAIGAGIEQR